jgi:hypothetical protein
MDGRGARLARGWTIGSFATALAAVSHAVAGGGTPSGLALVGGVVFGGMLGTLAVGRRPSLIRLTIAVGGSQLAFHSLFSLLGTGGVVSAAGHHHGAPMSLSLTATTHVEGPAMWLAHAAAGMVTLALLQGAERAAWRLLTELARLVAAPFRRWRPAPHPLRQGLAPLMVPSPAVLVARVFSSTVRRRGPPVLAA